MHAVLQLARQRTLLRARDLTERSLPTIVLTRPVVAGKLRRVARGVYGLPTRAPNEHSSLAEVCQRVPRGVVCLLSALCAHEIGTQAPFEVWIKGHFHSPRQIEGFFNIRSTRQSLPSSDAFEVKLLEETGIVTELTGQKKNRSLSCRA